MATLIVNSGRCSHGRCYFCGYGRIRGFEPAVENVNQCLDRFFKDLGDDEVKVFGSGSFLDEKQIPADSRMYFIGKCREHGVKRVTIESRPEYVNPEVLEEFRGLELTVAMGLETADERLLEKLNKGYGRREYEEASDIIHRSGGEVRTYLLVNPPFAKDIKEGLGESVDYALKHSDSIVLINMLPHKNSPLMKDYASGEWNFLSREEFRETTAEWSDDNRVELDEETYRFTPNFPDEMREKLKGVGEWHLTHPHFEVWQDYLIRWYRPPEGRILVFLPCAYRKPYSQSRTHQGIIEALRKAGRNSFHEVMLSNAGVIPREFEDHYPFNSYDWDERLETPEIKRRYIEVTGGRIRDYLTEHGKYYKRVVCFLKHDSESYKALEGACRETGYDIKNLLSEDTYERIRGEERPLQAREAMEDLEKGLRWCLENSM
ncbi:MAG: radical SAM protein [Candidatus Altiarchaeales archaeon]|nr:radical SAM protein [Candidatus Altiarchaeales archaeon]MBD3417197.1 radical SAM protein [Candidatus Altiarchaeales archaeon]